ncbi:MAG: hypothetical protein H0U22_09080 [Geodermatophilaceae bacterium]|nr:hypothetical protein [Geodermatophilaceae bacterium]
MRRRYRYGAWQGGPDPLVEPYDVATAVDALGDSVLSGESTSEALRRLMRAGLAGRRGLDALRDMVRKRLRQARARGAMDGTLREVQRLLDEALQAEQQTLEYDPRPEARLAESELASLPDDTAGAVRALADYDWSNPQAREKYQEIQDLLRREVLDSSFQKMREALTHQGDQGGLDPERLREMISELTDLIQSHNRGEDTTEAFEQFMERHGDGFPDHPRNTQELIDSLARQAAAQQRMLAGMSREQRVELANLISDTWDQLGLGDQIGALNDELRRARPDLRWDRGSVPDGAESLGLGDATAAVRDLADLEALSRALSQDYPGADLSDIDAQALENALGRNAADDLDALRELESELEDQGWLNRSAGKLTLSPKAVRRMGATALRRVFGRLSEGRRGQHDITATGPSGELTGSSRPWAFGDEQPIDVVETVRRAVLRTAGERPDLSIGMDALEPDDPAVRRKSVPIAVDDVAVVETERRCSAAVALLVDLSYSMALRGTWPEAKSTALALHTLVTTKFPQDAIQIIGFASRAREISAADLADLDVDTLQGTNLQHGLMLARRFLARHRDSEPIIMIVTDGEPTAHLTGDGRAMFYWPPLPETIALTMTEVSRCTRLGAQMNVFALDPDPSLIQFVDTLARQAGGRLFQPDPAHLGEYVVADYLDARRGRRARSA